MLICGLERALPEFSNGRHIPIEAERTGYVVSVSAPVRTELRSFPTQDTGENEGFPSTALFSLNRE